MATRRNRNLEDEFRIGARAGSVTISVRKSAFAPGNHGRYDSP